MAIFLLIFKSLPDLLWLIKHHVERSDRQAVRREIQDFAGAVKSGDADMVTRLLYEKVEKAKLEGK